MVGGLLRSAMMSMLVIISAVVSCSLVSCKSPGEPFAFKDVKISVGPSATPTQPATTHPTTIQFTIRNTWNKDLSTIPWEMRLNTDPANPLSGSVVTSGVVSIPAFGSLGQSYNLGTLAKGSYTYAIILDPANSISEDNESNNIGQVTILVADQDISFGPTTPNITINAGMGLPSSRQLTATFEILHTVSTTAPAPPAVAINVPYAVTLNGNPITPDIASIASPVNVNPAGTNPQTVTLTLPATGSAGSFPYVITLSPAAGDDNNKANNSYTVVLSVPASG